MVQIGSMGKKEDDVGCRWDGRVGGRDGADQTEWGGTRAWEPEGEGERDNGQALGYEP